MTTRALGVRKFAALIAEDVRIKDTPYRFRLAFWIKRCLAAETRLAQYESAATGTPLVGVPDPW